MIITVFSIALTIVCAVIAFKLGYTCGQTAERLDLLERFGEKREKTSETQQNTDVNIDTFHSDLQKIMNYTGVQGNE